MTRKGGRARRPGRRAASQFRQPRPATIADGRHVGFAWYRAEQWQRLHELDAGATQLHEQYEDWVASANRTIAELASHGIMVEKVPVDVEEIAAWCSREGMRFDSKARSMYVADLLRKRAAGS